MRHLSVWVIEFLKLLGERRPRPLAAQCPICGKMVRLHVNKAGRRHMLGHARALYRRLRDFRALCSKSQMCPFTQAKVFHPHPDENQHFKLPDSLRR